MKFFKLTYTYSILWSILIELTSCINTPESAIEQYKYEGMDKCAQTMVNYLDAYPIMEKVFEDSIVPFILRTYSFQNIVKAADVVVGRKSYDLIVNADIPTTKISEAFIELSPIESVNLYLNTYKRFKNVDEAFSNEIINKKMEQSSVPDMVKIHNLLVKTPKRSSVGSLKLSESKFINFINNLDIKGSVDLYSKLFKLFNNLDSLYYEYIIPVITELPYPAVKSISSGFKNTPFNEEIKNIEYISRLEYIDDIKKAIDNNKKLAIETYDSIVVIGMSLELDSISNSDSKKIVDKFSGGFLGHRKLTLLFGRDVNKFKELWNKYINENKYTDVFNTHIAYFLEEISFVQNENFKDYTGKNRTRVRYNLEAESISVDFPESLIAAITDYVNNNNKISIKKIWNEMVEQEEEDYKVLGALISGEEYEEKQKPDEVLRNLCQTIILSQIDMNYENIRDDVINVINISYDRLLKDIVKEL